MVRVVAIVIFCGSCDSCFRSSRSGGGISDIIVEAV